MLAEAPDQVDLISNEIRILSAELDSAWMCHIANKSPFPSSPTCDHVIVSYSQKIAEPGPRPINISIDQYSSQSEASDSTAIQHEPHNGEPPPDTALLPRLSNKAPYRRPSSPPDTMNIWNVLHDLDTSDFQSSDHDRTNLPPSPTTPPQPQAANALSCDREPPPPSVSTTLDQHSQGESDISEDPGTDSHACDGQIVRIPDNASDLPFISWQ
jgi:hypothetical protein